ncbi:indole-3-glycerol phosphate synthase [Streptacidiphilus fuscans]|uniref:Indole-3-glycerol phosphate synthase n=1 Tax=Streptacidiphilus fuscans TaxID=2789292 RepID=A0A931FHY4_9ACTN|nr:indole-3-glycerol phosphate synthase [Streptacidiphilus fuscans]MBF9071194.1 indole-3-glycerol phosphate synthase [Streptacidiphilus fuscans]
MFTTVLLIEKALSDADADMVTTLHGEEPVSFHVVMQPRGKQDELLRAIDDVAFGYLEQAAKERDEPHGQDALSAADASLQQTLRLLREHGAAQAEGAVVDHNPLDGLKDLVKEVEADEVIVLAAPHWVEGLFHRDWASQARHKVGVPVLQLFAQQA